ncbi:helix-turn-helix domain-containing protein [Acidiphilium acidophilum]|uniref:DUF4115 domain-containing protein n=1 Tax=Acidiphilium acidophilum TaxID=76588 RepID=A0AAW9DSK9_ACIAO|nr:RodZ domain-containing protein [Acidiphilium acidophilum]MDX5931047.1 DUF4115 domain-containing protein [Acidiphilium acidophilum]
MNSMNGNRDTGMKIPEFQTSDLSGPARVGAELRGVRERLGWKLPDVATRLKIRLPFLEAIEAGDLSALPAPAYAAGFIRSYSETMGLDPDEILRRFRAEGMTRPKQPTLSFPEPVPDRGVPPGAIVFLVAVIGIGAYFLWYRHSEHELKMAQMVPAVPAKLAPLAVPKQPVPKVVTAPKPAVTAPSTATPASGNPDTAVASGQGQTPASAPTDSSVATNGAAGPAALAVAASTGTSGSGPANGASTGSVAAGTASTASPAASATTAQGISGAAAPLVISASADSWVQVQGPSGTILFSRVLKAGSTWPVPDEPGLTLTTGNAGGTELIRNGVTGAPLGPVGAVMRHVPLTPAAGATAGAKGASARSTAPATPPTGSDTASTGATGTGTTGTGTTSTGATGTGATSTGAPTSSQ